MAAVPDPSTDGALPLGGAHHRALFDANPHGTFALDLDGLLIDVNDITADLTGYGRTQLLGTSFADLLVVDDLEAAADVFTAARAGEPQKVQVGITLAAGGTMDLNVAVVPVVVDGEVIGVAGVAEDVTTENAMRRELEEARETAIEAAAAKSLFLANMSHEVRTPLTSMLAVTEMLADSDLDSEQRQLVEVAKRSGHRLVVLVEDILDVSRLETGRMRLDQVDLELWSVLDDLVGWASPMAQRQDLDFVVDVAAAVPQQLHGDPERLSQVLTNLVANAIKFTDTGGVTLTVDSATDGDEATIRFTVADTGQGIPPDALASLFEPFTQLDPTQTRRHGGAGLGLAICRDLVRLMDGTLSATSEVGTGSRFTVTLPLRCPEATS